MISACLLGQAVRYDGGECLSRLDGEAKQYILMWQAQGLLVELCPEVVGGLAVPRPAAEIQGDMVETERGEDVTQAFECGAQQALDICKKYGIQYAILKQGSPSCGNSRINDGTFTKTKIEGQGKTAALLMQHNIAVFNESELSELNLALNHVTLKEEGIS
ncbi:MAG: DUF523 domain-containing protein [Ghiorsea sp.]|nr:DUF523 domain-containing protein [Ghiorsea sp.]